MQIFLKNESDKIITVKIENEEYRLLTGEGKYAFFNGVGGKMTVSSDEVYRSEAVTGKMGMNYFHFFVTETEYDFTAVDGATVRFYRETARGNNFESYVRVYPFSTECSFSLPFYTVKGENEIREKLNKSDKKEAAVLLGAGAAVKLLKAKNTFDDIVTALILGIIAVTVFVLIWIFKDFITAFKIYGAVAAVGFLLWQLVLKKVIEKGKKKAKNKAEEKFAKTFLPCENMPEGIFKGKHSYFESEYITAVFTYSTKRI